MDTLTKYDIVQKIYKNTSITHADSLELFESAMEIIKVTLEDGETVKLPGFGNFSVRSKRSRRGRNPKTGEEVVISARKVVCFHPSNILRDRVDHPSDA